jgi:Domain of unknown function (DUF5659)
MEDSALPHSVVYDTPDLHLASFLRCRGFAIVDLRREDNRTIFLFKDAPELRHAIVDYANDGHIAVRSFCNTLRDLKSLTRESGDRRGATFGNRS